MPFLRFTRDKRGYETTALVHASRRHGRARQRILYWFRTPPGVKVGRPALDEEAIRWIEEHNPEIEFNWQKILEAQPAPAKPSAEDGKNRRARRDTDDRRQHSSQSRVAAASASAPFGASASAPSAAADKTADKRGAPAFSPRASASAPSGATSDKSAGKPDAPEMSEPVTVSVAEAEQVEAIEDALEQLTHPDIDEQVPPTGTPVEKWVPAEQLVRLRARHAELQARITERGGNPARIEALRAQTESLNPDAWVTEEEARKGIEEFEHRIGDLRAALGLRRRRRSRRGGRGRRAGGPVHPNQTVAPAEPSNEGSEPSNEGREPE